MYHISLKSLLRDIDDPNGQCVPRALKPKKTKVRFCSAGGELEMLSMYTDGHDIWIDLQKPAKVIRKRGSNKS